MDDLLDSKSRKKQVAPPKWLRKIQETSWEAEILISFGALLVLFQLPDYLFLWSTSMNTTMGFSIAANLPIFLNLPLIILIIGFVAHLIIRGFWAGMIAMNFSFPNGINKRKLKWEGRFSSLLKNTRENTSIILDLEKLAGIIYGFTFLMFFSSLAVLIWLFIGFLLPWFIGLSGFDNNYPHPIRLIIQLIRIIYSALFLFGSVVYLIDFITLGWVKRSRRFSKIYFPFYKFLSFITLSYLSKNLYYTLITNIYKKQLFGGILGLTFVLSLLLFVRQESFSGGSEINPPINSFDPYSYGSLEDWDFKRATRISERITDNGFLEIYWLYDVNDEDSLQAFCTRKNIFADSLNLGATPFAIKQKCLDQFFSIYIDDTARININWEFFNYKKKGFPFYIMTTGIDVSNFQNGRHTITFHKANNKGIVGRIIPFYVSSNIN